MPDRDEDLAESRPLQLTRRQEDVVRALASTEDEARPLSQWYLGALYALSNPSNPDRIAQTAHSLRELVEKLLRVLVGTALLTDSYNIQENRRDLANRFVSDRARYSKGWEGATIDIDLSQTIQKASIYFENSQQPSRREQVQSMLVATDPLVGQFDSRILQSKRDAVHSLWKRLVSVAHHGSTDEQGFVDCFTSLEGLILDQLAPITAEEQQKIRSIIVQDERTDEDIELLFQLVERRGANYKYFFTELTDSFWVPILQERGYFSNPPDTEEINEEQQHTPYWWPMHYLSQVASSDPGAAVTVLLELPQVNNPTIHHQILDIACKLPGPQSTRLKEQIFQIAKSDIHFLSHTYLDLLIHWVAQDQYHPALELAGVLLRFQFAPQFGYGSSIQVRSRLDEWEYRRAIELAILPLAEKRPDAVARLLLDVTEEMITLRQGTQLQEPKDKEDHSELWCRRLDRVDDRLDEASNLLVLALTLACERVFADAPDSVSNLDDALRSRRWKLFRRLREHLYSKFPNDETRPWIRDLLFERNDYQSIPHRYEFQKMLKSACDAFGEELLSIEERRFIFDSILSGSPAGWVTARGVGYASDFLVQRWLYFHKKQLRPFVTVLFGYYLDYYKWLDSESEERISDDDYLLVGDTKGGAITMQSPRSVEDLSNIPDFELLDFINRWTEERNYESGFSGDGWLIEINIQALADAFKAVFRDSILPDYNKLLFWIENLSNIERTVYVEALIKAMEEYVRDNNVDRLEESIGVCEWILSHPDEGDTRVIQESDRSHGAIEWRNARRAVADFVEGCLEGGKPLSVSAREGIARLLGELCTQPDWRLDNNIPVFLNGSEPYTEAINNTRSKALRSLVTFGLLVKREYPGADVSFVTEILEGRFSSNTGLPLTIPEYAVLGVRYANLLYLDADWTVRHEKEFFPQQSWDCWEASFGSLLRFTKCYRDVFDTLRAQFEFGVENLPSLEDNGDKEATLTEKLGEHLFIYFLWGMYPLEGDGSILELFFDRTARQREQWGILFRRVGLILYHADAIEDDRKERVKKFFEWRLRQGEAKEMDEFGYWFESDILEPEWRLHAFARALEIGQPDAFAIYGVMKTLSEMLEGHSDRVVACFAKLVKKMESHPYRIETETARGILKAGMSSPDPGVQKEALEAHEYLLKRGRSDLLDLNA